jgi:MerR family transcriptional regulator, light-induced transcriptional regulator
MTPRTSAGSELRYNIELLADALTTAQFEGDPQLAARYGRLGRLRCLEDARFHISFLAAAVDANSEALFLDYIGWTKTVLVSRRIAADDLRKNLQWLEMIVERETPSAARVAVPFIRTALAKLDSMPVDVPTFIDAKSVAGGIAKSYLERLLDGDTSGGMAVIAEALAHGSQIPNVCTDVLHLAQQEVGRLWQLDAISVATEHYCSGVTQQVVSQICTPRRASKSPQNKKIVTMCAPGELHDIGMRIVSELLRLEQWEVFHLGANVPAKPAVEMCVSRKADLLVVSATLPPHIAAVAEVVQLVRDRRELKGMRVIVGGRAFAQHPEVVQFTGADGYADSPAGLVELLRAM